MKILQNISNILATLDRHPRRCMWITTLSAVVYYLLISLQGFDFADEGFSLTFYQNFYSHPADVEYLFLYYLTGMIGGAWELLFGSLGNYGYRILFALTSGGIVLTTFSILRNYLSSSTITLGCLACVLWPGLCLYYFNHDCLTILLYLLTIYSITLGIKGKSWAWWLTGWFIILNTSCRLPNITLSILILTPFIEGYSTNDYFKAWKNMLRIIGGCIVGTLLLLLIMHLQGHTTIYSSAIRSLFIMSGDSSDTHSIMSMLGSYAYTYKGIFTSALYGLLICMIYLVATQHIKVKGIELIMGIISIALFYGMLDRNIYAMWGAVTAATIIYSIRYHHDSRLLILGLSALIMLIVVPLGGDSYGNICNSCLWLGMPLLIELCRRRLMWKITISDTRQRQYDLTIDNHSARQLTLIMGITFLLYSSTHSECYFDNGSRWTKTHRPSIAEATTYTSQERAYIIDNITRVILQNKMPGNYLLVFDNAPMLHYLTDMKPYLGSPWSTFWGIEMFENELFQSEHSVRELPLIAIPRFYYEDLTPVDYLNPVEYPSLHKKASILFDFMKRNGYYQAYQDAYITLYKV